MDEVELSFNFHYLNIQKLPIETKNKMKIDTKCSNTQTYISNYSIFKVFMDLGIIEIPYQTHMTEIWMKAYSFSSRCP